VSGLREQIAAERERHMVPESKSPGRREHHRHCEKKYSSSFVPMQDFSKILTRIWAVGTAPELQLVLFARIQNAQCLLLAQSKTQ
jgi:hypothetical protein